MNKVFLLALNSGNEFAGLIMIGLLVIVAIVIGRFLIDYLYRINYRTRLQEAHLILLAELLKKEGYDHEAVEGIIHYAAGKSKDVEKIYQQLVGKK